LTSIAHQREQPHNFEPVGQEDARPFTAFYESLAEKFEYIRQNPVRAGLITQNEEWLYAIDASDLDSRTGASVAYSTGD